MRYKPITCLIAFIIVAACQTTESEKYVADFESGHLGQALSSAQSRVNQLPSDISSPRAAIRAVRAYGNLGLIYLKLGRRDEAQTAFLRAAKIASEHEVTRLDEIHASSNLARFYLSVNQPSVARGFLDAALSEANNLVDSDRDVIPILLSQDLQLAMAEDDFKAAEGAAHKLGELAQDKSVDMRHRMQINGILSQYWKEIGNLANALNHLSRIVALEGQKGSEIDVARAYADIGEIESKSGQSAKALLSYARALTIYRSIGYQNQLEQASILGRMAIDQARLSESELAVQTAKDAVRVAQQQIGFNPIDGIPARAVLSEVLYQSGEYSSARQVIEEILEILKGIPDESARLQRVDFLLNAVELDRKLKRFDAAEAALFSIESISDTLNEHNRAASLLKRDIFSAELQLTTGLPKQALETFRRARDQSRRLFNGEGPYADRIEVGIISALRASGRADEAEPELYEFLNAAMSLDQNREAGRFAALAREYLDIVYDNRDAQKYSQAFKVAQFVRNRRTGNSIGQMAQRLRVGDGNFASRLQDRQRLQTERGEMLRMLEGKPNQAVLSQTMQRINEVDRLVEKIDTDLMRQNPQFNTFLRSSIPSVGEARSVLSEGEVLVQFLIDGGNLYIIALTLNEVRIIRQQNVSKRLGEMIAKVRRHLDPALAAILDPYHLPALFPADIAAELYDILLRPIVRDIQNLQHLIIIPDGPMYGIPLEVLITKPSKSVLKTYADYNEAHWLIKHFAVSYVPDVTSFVTLRQTEPARKLQANFLGIGDPVLSDHPSRGGVRGGVERIKPGDVRVSDIHSRGIVDRGKIFDYKSLPETAGELTRIRDTLGRGTLLLREEARQRNLFELEDLENYNIISFATHGATSNQIPGITEPGLIMTPDMSGGTDEDGYLSTSEIMSLTLNADLVILSACNTATSDGQSGDEGFTGLARAFLFAGARQLLVSHWLVFSDPTVGLMTDFIERLYKRDNRRDYMQTVLAFNAARLHFFNSEEDQYAHPTYWASFVLVGSQSVMTR